MPKGKPIFTYGDIVEFDVYLTQDAPEPVALRGEVYVVDSHGTFEQNEYASYDIMVADFGETGCLFKHIIEPNVRAAL